MSTTAQRKADMAETHRVAVAECLALTLEIQRSLAEAIEERKAGKITWGHVGSLGALRKALEDASNFI